MHQNTLIEITNHTLYMLHYRWCIISRQASRVFVSLGSRTSCPWFVLMAEVGTSLRSSTHDLTTDQWWVPFHLDDLDLAWSIGRYTFPSWWEVLLHHVFLPFDTIVILRSLGVRSLLVSLLLLYRCFNLYKLNFRCSLHAHA